MTCGLIAAKLMVKLEEEHDIHNLQAINPAMTHLVSAAASLIVRVGTSLFCQEPDRSAPCTTRFPIPICNTRWVRMPKSDILKLREGLDVGSACEAGELFQAILDRKRDDELKWHCVLFTTFEIQPLANNRFMLANEKYEAKTDEDLREYNRKIVRLGEELGKPVVATGDVHFLNPEDEIFRHILLATKGFDDADKDMPLYFRTTDDMLREFSYLGEEKAYEVVITNPNRIADMCESLRPVPHNLFAPKIENSVEDLKNLVYTKFHRLYGDNPPELMVKRVETELHDIINCHYDVIQRLRQAEHPG